MMKALEDAYNRFMCSIVGRRSLDPLNPYEWYDWAHDRLDGKQTTPRQGLQAIYTLLRIKRAWAFTDMPHMSDDMAILEACYEATRDIIYGKKENRLMGKHVWNASVGSGGQGLVADEVTGRTIAVCYNKRNAPLLAAAPKLLNACIAALSQLTEDRPEYLEFDVNQLRETIAEATEKP